MPSVDFLYPVDIIYMGVVLGFIVFGELVILSVHRQHRKDRKKGQSKDEE